MTAQEALNILDEAAAAVACNRQTHIRLAEAVKVLSAIISTSDEKKPE